MFSPTQVIFFSCFFVLQSFEELVELPSAEDIANFAREQDQEREELHFKVWLRHHVLYFLMLMFLSLAIVLDTNAVHFTLMV